MNCLLAKITKVEFEMYILPFIPKNKRGFASKVDNHTLFCCMLHKLKTGSQWARLFIDIECVNVFFSWQLVYYYYRKWVKMGVFENMHKVLVALQSDKLDTENLNLDGTHSLAKTAGEDIGYQPRKKGRTSNVVVMTDGNGIPIAVGDIFSGNHNDLYKIVPQVAKMAKGLNECGISLHNSILNADKGFDCNSLRRACARRKMLLNAKENVRNRKTKKRGRKRFFNEPVYLRRFVNERCFAWMDSFKTLLVRFDTLVSSWLSWHYLAASLILIKV